MTESNPLQVYLAAKTAYENIVEQIEQMQNKTDAQALADKEYNKMLLAYFQLSEEARRLYFLPTKYKVPVRTKYREIPIDSYHGGNEGECKLL